MSDKYPFARPFDFVREFIALKKQVANLSVRAPTSPTAWTVLTLANSWTGTFSARIKSDNQLQLSGYHLFPGTISSGITLTTLTGSMVPAGNHEVTIATDAISALASGVPRAAIRTDGTITLFGVGAAAVEISIEATIPLDI